VQTRVFEALLSFCSPEIGPHQNKNQGTPLLCWQGRAAAWNLVFSVVSKMLAGETETLIDEMKIISNLVINC